MPIFQNYIIRQELFYGRQSLFITFLTRNSCRLTLTRILWNM